MNKAFIVFLIVGALIVSSVEADRSKKLRKSQETLSMEDATLSAGSQVFFFSCSKPADNTTWTYYPSFSTITCSGSGYTYLGPYGSGGYATSPIFNLDTHSGVVVSLRLAFIDSWDGEAFKILADGTVVYSETHEYLTQSTSNTCQNEWTDAYENLTFGFNHTASTLTLQITSELDQDSSDEAWGICNLYIAPTTNPVTASGATITVTYVNVSGFSYFSCSAPSDDNTWTYSPEFTTIECAGTGYTYLGPYGSGGTITSPAMKFSTHYGIIVSLKLAFIDSWDGEAFNILADSTVVYSETHEYLTQSTSNTCQNQWTDAYENLTFGFNHTASTLTLQITSELDQDSSDEAWGIFNLTVKGSTAPVYANGTVVKAQTLSLSGSTWFSCSNPSNDNYWAYSPSFSTITCSGTGYTYLGPYGAGGTVTAPLLSVGTHAGIIVSFQLAFIDSWDGEAFLVYADGDVVYSETHEYLTQSTSNTCQNQWTDAYESLTFGFNHTASYLQFYITSGLDQDSSDEAWGICNLNLQPSSCPVTAAGNILSC